MMGGGMWIQFFEQNMHFAVYMFTSLVFFAVAWLYFDAWNNHHAKKEFFKWSGFALAGISFIIQALIIEQSSVSTVLLGGGADAFASALRLIGFGAILYAQIIDPLQAVPNLKGLDIGGENEKNPKQAPAWYAPVSVGAHVVLPFAAFAIAWLYFRRATTGLERHLRKVAYAFAAFAFSEILNFASYIRDTDNPVLYDAVRLYGPVWLLQHAILLFGAVYLGRWVWYYLTKRFFSQLLMIFMLTVGAVFLVISVGFTGLLLRDIRANSLANLEVSTQVLKYAFSAKQSEATSAAEQVAGSAEVINAVQAKDHQALVRLTKDYLVNKQQSDLVITDQAGQVLLRATDSERWGDSISSDPLIKRALLGVGKSGVVVDEGINVPVLQLKSAAIIKTSDGTIIGAVASSLNLDTSFINGVKESTGLNSALYAGDTLIATTRMGEDGKSSSVGARLTDKQIVDTVIKNGEQYSGRLVFANKDYLGAFVPVKDPDNIPVAILSVDQAESSILETAGKSVELTFILAAGLLVVSVVPVFLITRNLVKQIQ